jgi:hypothetical protein
MTVVFQILSSSSFIQSLYNWSNIMYAVEGASWNTHESSKQHNCGVVAIPIFLWITSKGWNIRSLSYNLNTIVPFVSMQKKICKQAALFRTRHVWIGIHMHCNSNINMHKPRLALSLPHAADFKRSCAALSVRRRKMKTLWTLRTRNALMCVVSFE